MAIYQVGVVIAVERVTDVLVRVEAPSAQDAEIIARDTVRQKIEDGCTVDDLVTDPEAVTWLEDTISVEGGSDTDYSDMSPDEYPHADIDLTEEQ